MESNDALLERRTVLRAIGATAAGASIAGCTSLGAITGDDGGGSDDTVLGKPKNYDRGSDIELPYPRYGEALPEATVPAPLQDRTLSTREFVGDRHVVVTFVYTSCTTVCPGLTAALRRVQADSIEEGYADEVALLPITFDPAHDTAPVLAEYADSMGVDRSVGNWFFLRPESPERAQAVVDETFGVAFEKQDDADGDAGDGANDTTADSDDTDDTSDGDDTDDDTSDGDGTDDDTMDGEGHDGHGGHERVFIHSSLILVANADGVVERAYTGGPPQTGTLAENVRTIVERW